MANGLPNETSIFETRTVDDIYSDIRAVYRRYELPWVVGFSGGKDSTAALQLVWKALEALPPEERKKPVYVISTDTKVETPVIVDYIDGILDSLQRASDAAGMPFQVQKLKPSLNDSFWVNLIGRGYPAPTTRFRWCTERMKINPANRFIQEKVSQHGEVIMVLGMRKTESATRGQLMNAYQVHDTGLMRHAYLPGAYVYAPLSEFSTDDVWSYLLQVPSPWGADNRDLAALYRNASQGECPLVVDTSTPSCGNSRFGCWVCTVAERDSSMEAMIDNGQEWLEPLLEFRDWLNLTTDPRKKREFRDIRGRDGRMVLTKDGQAAARTYKLETSKEMLRKVLQTQVEVRRQNPSFQGALIEDDELMEIRRIWRTERQDWDDSVPDIYRGVTGRDLAWPQDDNGAFDGNQKTLLANICEEYEVPFDLVAKLLEVERRSHGMARRAGIQKGIAAVLKQDWRSEEQFVAQATLERDSGLFQAWDEVEINYPEAQHAEGVTASLADEEVAGDESA